MSGMMYPQSNIAPVLIPVRQGIPPATLAEFTLSGSGGLDYYDGGLLCVRSSLRPPHLSPFLRCFLVSLVDGYNLPMSITNNVGCSVADCPVDLGPDCAGTHRPYCSAVQLADRLCQAQPR